MSVHKYGNTQVDISDASAAGKALSEVRALIPDEHLAGDGKDIGNSHVTVRYGIVDDDCSGIEAYLSQQAPFDAVLGVTSMFEPTEHSEGAAVIIAPVDSRELREMNWMLSLYGLFKAPDFDYTPHATVAYVKREHAEKYTALNMTSGKSFRVDSVTISKRDGSRTVVKLRGKK